MQARACCCITALCVLKENNARAANTSLVARATQIVIAETNEVRACVCLCLLLRACVKATHKCTHCMWLRRSHGTPSPHRLPHHSQWECALVRAVGAMLFMLCAENEVLAQQAFEGGAVEGLTRTCEKYLSAPNVVDQVRSVNGRGRHALCFAALCGQPVLSAIVPRPSYLTDLLPPTPTALPLSSPCPLTFQ